ncbi:MAG: NosD domain-containing protein [bacterium]
MKNKRWILLFYIFMYFVCCGHSFWPLQKRNKNEAKSLFNPRPGSSQKKDISRPVKRIFREEDIVISQDTIWSGKLEIEQVVLVKKGAELTISPGTELFFSGPKIESDDVHAIHGGGIKVEGRIHAEGTVDKPIIFSGKNEVPGGWGNIFLTYSQDNVFTYCIFEYANFAIHAHFSSLNISNSLFANNNEGCRLGFSQAVIKNSIFRLNEARGINFRAGRHEIINNSIVANRVGIFIYENGNQSKIFSNNIFNNAEYNLQLGDFHKENVTMSNNYWGKVPDYDKLIHDKNDDENIGKVEIIPLIEEEIHWENEEKVKILR